MLLFLDPSELRRGRDPPGRISSSHMHRPMKTNSLAFLIFLSFLSTNASAGLLDGTRWNVQVVPTRQTANKDAQRFEDVLSFARDRLTSKELKQRGLGPVRYQATGTPAFYNWETAPVLRGKNKAHWEGVVKGQNIKGNLKWVTRDGRTLYYYVNGKKR